MLTSVPMARKSPGADPFSRYLHEIQRNLSSDIAAEQTHRHALQDLLEVLDPKIPAFNDPKHIRVGAPDFTIRRKGNSMAFPVGWVETKDIGENLDDAEKSDQLIASSVPAGCAKPGSPVEGL
jgi:hypothetical protein